MVRQNNNKKVLKLVEGEGRRKSGPIMGIDVHKDVLAYCVLTETKILREFQVKNNNEGINNLIGIIKKLHVSSVAVESTAQYHFKLVFKLIDSDIPVLVANPQQTKTTQGKKTDKIDAQRIAIAHRDGRLKPSVITSKQIFNLRKAMRNRLNLTNETTKIKQRLNQIFHQKDFKHKYLIKSKLGLELLYLTSIRMVKDEYLNSLSIRNSKIFQNNDLIEDLKKFQDKFDEIECITFGIEVQQLRLMNLSIEQQDMAYYAVAKENYEFLKQIKLLLTVPGIGPMIAATVLAEIADISYFPNHKKLVKWAGLAPRVYQSGHRKHITGKIHKGGNKYLRRAIVMACQNIYAKGNENNSLKKFMQSKKKQKDNYWLAICAGARKLLSIIWYMLKNNLAWGKFKLSNDIRLALEGSIMDKIKLFESKSKKYRKVLDRLSGKYDNLLEDLPKMDYTADYLLKTLLNSV
jgi:transposase